MRARAERLARALWAGELGPAGPVLLFVLMPVEALWRVGAGWAWRRAREAAPARIDGVRVVSVGNLAVGGTGKTPLASWALAQLSRAGAQPALIIGGHAADEAELHRRWTPTVPVVECRDRVEGVRAAARAGADVVVVDDGFQHHRLGRDLDVVILAVEDGPPDRLLPRGPFREPLEALERADAVVLTRRASGVEESRAFAHALRMRLEARGRSLPPTASLRSSAGELVPIEVWAHAGDPSESTGSGPVDPLAVSAIAKPSTFAREVAERWGGGSGSIAFADHHAFTARDAERIRAEAGDRAIVITEKDAVKLARFRDVLGPTWVLGQRLEWDWGESGLAAALARVVRSVA